MSTSTVIVAERDELNIIVVPEDWTPGPGVEVIDRDSLPPGAAPGWRRMGGTWTAPPPPPKPEPDRVDVLQEQLDELLLDTLTAGAATQDQLDELLLTTLDVTLEQQQQRAELDELILATLG